MYISVVKWKLHYVMVWCKIAQDKSCSMIIALGRLNIKIPSYEYRKSHYTDKTVSRPSYLNNGNPILGKTVFILRQGPCDIDLGDRIQNASLYCYSKQTHLEYRQTSNIRRTLVGNDIADDSDVVACRCCCNYILIIDLTPGFNGLDKDNCKTRRETFRFWYLVRLILEVWR